MLLVDSHHKGAVMRSFEVRFVSSKAKLLNIPVDGDAHNNDAIVMFNNVIWPWKCYSNNFYFEQPLKHLFMVSVMPLRTSHIEKMCYSSQVHKVQSLHFLPTKNG